MVPIVLLMFIQCSSRRALDDIRDGEAGGKALSSLVLDKQEYSISKSTNFLNISGWCDFSKAAGKGVKLHWALYAPSSHHSEFMDLATASDGIYGKPIVCDKRMYFTFQVDTPFAIAPGEVLELDVGMHDGKKFILNEYTTIPIRIVE